MSTQLRKSTGRPVNSAKRDAIIAAAANSFFDVGYAASSIEQIAAAAGVSKVTVYSHFGDKRTLLSASVQRECEKMRSHFAIEATGDGGLRDRLLTIGTAMSAFLSRPEMVQFERRIAAETEHEPEIGLAFLENGPRRMRAAFVVMLQHEIELGNLAIADPDLAAEQFVSMCKGMGDLERRFGAPVNPTRDRERVEGAVDVFLHAYAVRA